MPTVGMLKSRPRLSEESSVFRETGHKVKVRNIEFLVTNTDHFITSGDDGFIQKWQMTSDAHAKKVLTFDARYNGSSPAAFYNAHTDSVTGISGHLERFQAISVGRDKRIVVFDLEKEKVVLREKIDAKCVGVAANPIDSNLFCVQTSVDGEQLRLLDMRYQDGEVAAFGWKKPDDLQNSALVAPAWSPSGLLLTAGSGGREVKIFDIRYHVEQKPLSCERSNYQGKVYKVAWAQTRKVLVSTGDTKDSDIYASDSDSDVLFRFRFRPS